MIIATTSLRRRVPLLLALGLAVSAHAAPPCRTACMPDEVRDTRNCCVPRAATAGKKDALGCAAGQEITDETAGHCCWPGQVWSKVCVGVPTKCPEGLVVEAAAQRCAPPACDGGKVRAQDEVHCCWPGQAWSASRAICVGVPESCPAGTAVALLAQSCQPVPSCTNGLTLTEDSLHCCWGGQKWVDRCQGPPTCPAGFAVSGEQCSPVPVCKPGLSLTPDQLHCCFAGQTWSGTACVGTPRCAPPLEARKERCLPPLAPHVATILSLTARRLPCEKDKETVVAVKRLEVVGCRLILQRNWGGNSDEHRCWYSARVENDAEVEFDEVSSLYAYCRSGTEGLCTVVVGNNRVFNFGLYLTATSLADARRLGEAVRRASLACGGKDIPVQVPEEPGR